MNRAADLVSLKILYSLITNLKSSMLRGDKEALSKDDVIKILQTCVTPKLRLFVHILN